MVYGRYIYVHLLWFISQLIMGGHHPVGKTAVINMAWWEVGISTIFSRNRQKSAQIIAVLSSDLAFNLRTASMVCDQSVPSGNLRVTSESD